MSTPSPAGWYDDPDSPEQLRYFDGVVWTSHTTPRRTRPDVPAPTYQSTDAPAGQAQQPLGSQQWHGMPQRQGAAYSVAPTTPDGVRLASYGLRVGAYLVDSIIQGLITAVFAGWLILKALDPAMTSLQNAVSANDPTAMNAALAKIDYRWFAGAIVISLVVQFAYQVSFLTRTGATPGKSLVGISVRLRERPGPLTLETAFKRVGLVALFTIIGLVPFLGTFGSVATVLDLLWPAWDSRKQAWHDKVAATNVVRGPQLRQASGQRIR